MKRVTIIVAAGLFAVAAIATGILRRSTVAAPTTTTTSTTTTIPLATWIDPAEIVVPPAIIVPTGIETDGGIVIVDYDLVSMSGGDAAVRPTAWTLIAGPAEFEAEVDPASSRVSFDVGFDFDPDSITGLRLDRYVVRSPLQTTFEPALDDFTTSDIAPGVTAALDIVQQQTSGVIVRVQLGAALLGAVGDLAAEGLGPGWVTASSNFGGGGLWTLSYDGDTLPDPLELRVRGIVWVPIETDLVSSLEGVPSD